MRELKIQLLLPILKVFSSQLELVLLLSAKNINKRLYNTEQQYRKLMNKSHINCVGGQQ